MRDYLDYENIKISRIHACAFCNKEYYKGDPMVKININNREIIEEVFGLVKTRFTKRSVYVCHECFQDIHQELERIESKGWVTLE